MPRKEDLAKNNFLQQVFFCAGAYVELCIFLTYGTTQPSHHEIGFILNFVKYFF